MTFWRSTGFHRVGNLRPNRFPELKAFLHRYPIQLRSTVGQDELHGARPHKFSDKILVEMPDALAV
jgi:hypothetical protein